MLPFQGSQLMPQNKFLWEALDLIGSTTIVGVFYGIVFTLYFLCAQSLYLKIHKPDQKRQARFNLGYISLLLFCSTSMIALNTWMIQMAYIKHAGIPGGPLAFERERNSTNISLSLAGCLVELVIDISTMAVQVGQRPQVINCTDRTDRSGVCGSSGVELRGML